MALYNSQAAKLGDLEGVGYLFRNRSARGSTYQGIFFGPEGEGAALEALVEHEPVTFAGVLYKKTLSGTISSEIVEVPVAVKSYRAVSAGDRAVIEAIEG